MNSLFCFSVHHYVLELICYGIVCYDMVPISEGRNELFRYISQNMKMDLINIVLSIFVRRCLWVPSRNSRVMSRVHCAIFYCFNPLVGGRCSRNLELVIFKFMSKIVISNISCEITYDECKGHHRWLISIFSGAVRQQGITRAIFDLHRCHHMEH